MLQATEASVTAALQTASPHSISLPCLLHLHCHSIQTLFATGYLLNAARLQSLRLLGQWWYQQGQSNDTCSFQETEWLFSPVSVSLSLWNPNEELLRAVLRKLGHVEILFLLLQCR